jgi:hypothetical protein
MLYKAHLFTPSIFHRTQVFHGVASCDTCTPIQFRPHRLLGNEKSHALALLNNKGHHTHAREGRASKGYRPPQAILKMPGLTVPDADVFASEATLVTTAAWVTWNFPFSKSLDFKRKLTRSKIDQSSGVEHKARDLARHGSGEMAGPIPFPSNRVTLQYHGRSIPGSGFADLFRSYLELFLLASAPWDCRQEVWGWWNQVSASKRSPTPGQ